MLRKAKIVVYYEDKYKAHLGKRFDKYLKKILNEYFVIGAFTEDKEIKIDDIIE